MQQTNPMYQQQNSKVMVTSVIAGNRRRLNYTFEDKSELIEEYDIKSHEPLSKKWRRAQDFKESNWDYEIGEAPATTENQLIKSNLNPIFVRKDTQQHFQFRIRNLNYPEEAYIVEVDEDKQEVVVKTTVKKYYKKFAIPDLRRLNLKLEKDKIKWVYKNSTLLISYPKPQQVLQKEQDLRTEFDKFNKKNPKEGDIECVHQ